MNLTGLDTRGWRLHPCPACQTSDFTPLAHHDRYGFRITTSGCNTCGLVQTNPRPDAAWLDAFYATRYRWLYQSVVRPDADYLRRTKKLERAAQHAEALAELADLPDRPRVLDVGSAEGCLLAAIAARLPGAELHGVEPDAEFRGFSRTLCPTLRAYARIDDALLGGQTFDLTTLIHVFEHLPDCVPVLARLARHLADGGRIILDVPNVSRYRTIGDLHIAHLFHFSEATLTRVAQQAALRVDRLDRHQTVRHPPSLRAVCVRAPAGSAAEPPPDRCAWPIIRGLWKHRRLHMLRRPGRLAAIVRARGRLAVGKLRS